MLLAEDTCRVSIVDTKLTDVLEGLYENGDVGQDEFTDFDCHFLFLYRRLSVNV